MTLIKWALAEMHHEVYCVPANDLGHVVPISNSVSLYLPPPALTIRLCGGPELAPRELQKWYLMTIFTRCFMTAGNGEASVADFKVCLVLP